MIETAVGVPRYQQRGRVAGSSSEEHGCKGVVGLGVGWMEGVGGGIRWHWQVTRLVGWSDHVDSGS